MNLMKLQGLMKDFIELMRCEVRFRTEREYKDVFRCENSVFGVSDQRHQVPENVERERERRESEREERERKRSKRRESERERRESVRERGEKAREKREKEEKEERERERRRGESQCGQM